MNRITACRQERERETENLVRLLKKKTFLLKHNTTINVLNGAHFPPAKTEAGSEPTTCRYNKLTSPTIIHPPPLLIFSLLTDKKKYCTFNVFVDTDEEKRQAFLRLTVVWSLFSTQLAVIGQKYCTFNVYIDGNDAKGQAFLEKT